MSRISIKRYCKVANCEIHTKAKGYCSKHYMRYYEYGPTLDFVEKPVKREFDSDIFKVVNQLLDKHIKSREYCDKICTKY